MNSDPARLMTWDTEFFGVRTARALGPIADCHARERLEEWCAENQIDWLHVLLSAGDLDSVRQLEAAGYSFVDIRMTLLRRGGPAGSGEPGEGLLLRSPFDGDLESLVTIARNAHTDSRFFNDPRLPHARASALYEEWLKKCCAGALADSVVVAEMSGAPVGYATGQMRESERGVIGLVGVDDSARGRGLGGALVREISSRLAKLGSKEIEVVTQGRNVAAQRLYHRAGFAVGAVELWYHKWFDR